MTSQELTIALYRAVGEVEQDDRTDYWHASTIAACPRANYFARLGVESLSEASGAKKLRWATGHALEGVIRPHLQSIYPSLVSNVRFTNAELGLTGEIDNYDPDTKAIIEVKSVHPNAVRYRRKGEDRYHLKDDQQYLHHEYQQHAYVKLMSDPKTHRDVATSPPLEGLPQGFQEEFKKRTQLIPSKWDVERIIYLYVNLSGLIVAYDTAVKPDILEAVDKRLDILNKAWKSKTPPDCFCEESHPLYKGQTQYCAYKTDTDCCSLRLLDKVKETV